jgi:hypothetical protein
MRRARTLWILLPFLALGGLVLGGPVRAGDDLSEADLSGAWYVMVRYKDSRSEDKTIEKFKDFAWSIEQTENTLTWEHYPYVVFGEEAEQFRRHAMMNHEHWEPDESQWEMLKTSLPVSSRAMQRKRMKGNLEEGFKSLPPLSTGGFNTMTFTREWHVKHGPEKVQITIIDSLTGTGGLEGMDEAIHYEITERAGDRELRGTYREAAKSGTFRMVKSREHQVVK